MVSPSLAKICMMKLYVLVSSMKKKKSVLLWSTFFEILLRREVTNHLPSVLQPTSLNTLISNPVIRSRSPWALQRLGWTTWAPVSWWECSATLTCSCRTNGRSTCAPLTQASQRKGTKFIIQYKHMLWLASMTIWHLADCNVTSVQSIGMQMRWKEDVLGCLHWEQ